MNTIINLKSMRVISLSVLIFLIQFFVNFAYGQTVKKQERTIRNPDVYYRMQRMLYEKQLKIDSSTAIALVKADEAEQKGRRAILVDRSLDVTSRAKKMERLRLQHQQQLTALLSQEQLTRLFNSSGNIPKSTRIIEANASSNSMNSAFTQLQQEHQESMKTVLTDSNLDVNTKQEKIKKLMEGHRRSVEILYERDRKLKKSDSVDSVSDKGKKQ